MRVKELTLNTDYLASDSDDWLNAAHVRYYRLVSLDPWETAWHGTTEHGEPVTLDLGTETPARVRLGNKRRARSWRGAYALMVPVRRTGEVVRDDEGNVAASLVALRTLRTTRAEGWAQRTERAREMAELAARTAKRRAANAERAAEVTGALGAGRYVAHGTYVGTVYEPTVTLTLDEAADVATRLRMLDRATRAEVAEGIREAFRVSMREGLDPDGLDAIAARVVERLGALRADLDEPARDGEAAEG
jgi:hypothetical protein